MENIDIASIKVPVAICPFMDLSELAPEVDAEFECNDVDEEEKKFSRLLAEQFDVVYRALKAGETIDDDWVRAQD